MTLEIWCSDQFSQNNRKMRKGIQRGRRVLKVIKNNSTIDVVHSKGHCRSYSITSSLLKEGGKSSSSLGRSDSESAGFKIKSIKAYVPSTDEPGADYHRYYY